MQRQGLSPIGQRGEARVQGEGRLRAGLDAEPTLHTIALDECQQWPIATSLECRLWAGPHAGHAKGAPIEVELQATQRRTRGQRRGQWQRSRARLTVDHEMFQAGLQGGPLVIPKGEASRTLDQCMVWPVPGEGQIKCGCIIRLHK
jgi:hypothetical protein